MLGGNPSRARISQASGRVGAKQKQIPLARSTLAGTIPPQLRQQLQTEDRQARDAGLNLGVIPVVDRGELFFQDNAYIYARNLESGMALPGCGAAVRKQLSAGWPPSTSGWETPLNTVKSSRCSFNNSR